MDFLHGWGLKEGFIRDGYSVQSSVLFVRMVYSTRIVERL
jgi:hypothetical protein